MFICVDAEDFDPEAGFSKGGEGGEEETWEGEDEGLVIEDDKEEVKSKRMFILACVYVREGCI